jgi:predicted DNA-binding protein (MmcQ/YjbR family)
MQNLSTRLKNREIDYKEVEKFGFIKKNNIYEYNKKINNNFNVLIIIEEEKIISKVVDNNTNEEYVLVDVPVSIGEYIAKIKTSYENIIQDFINKCTYKKVFKSVQAQQVIEYVRSNFGGELEFLWKDDDDAIWRNKDNNKWYGLIMVINANKLDQNRQEIVDVINLKYQKDCSDEIVDNKSIFKAYHMNKRSWISIILDGSVSNDVVFTLIDNSYNLIK